MYRRPCERAAAPSAVCRAGTWTLTLTMKHGREGHARESRGARSVTFTRNVKTSG